MLFRRDQLPNQIVLRQNEIEEEDNNLLLQEDIGFDIALTKDGDLELNSKGDINTLSADQSIAVSLLRRVLTPPGGYSRMFNEFNEVVEYGKDLENIAYSYLSANKTDVIVRDLLTKLKELAEVDNRIEILDVELKPSGLNNINIDLTYKTRTSTVLKNLIYQFK